MMHQDFGAERPKIHNIQTTRFIWINSCEIGLQIFLDYHAKVVHLYINIFTGSASSIIWSNTEKNLLPEILPVDCNWILARQASLATGKQGDLVHVRLQLKLLMLIASVAFSFLMPCLVESDTVEWKHGVSRRYQEGAQNLLQKNDEAWYICDSTCSIVLAHALKIRTPRWRSGQEDDVNAS